ncbi:ABC transporter substrate-binding protein [Candidatus Microgenomates bacterium]|nr:ABC transporter substrate-binding protein [Candidatus Microgenomates bacterium]
MKKIVYQKKPKISDLKNKRIGIHGIKGSFTDEALDKLAKDFGLKPNDYQVVELVHARKVLEAVARGKVDRGIFAFANSGSGGYIASLGAMGDYCFKVSALFRMPLRMCLLSHPTMRDIKKITEFRGHPVAIAQSLKTLKRKWPKILIRPGTDKLDTALSAQYLKAGKFSRTTAIFASERAAQIYNLNILKKDVHHDPNNATFFLLVKKGEKL